MLAGQMLGEVVAAHLPLSEYQRRVDWIMRPALEQSLRMRRVIDFARNHDSLFLMLMWLFNRRGWKSFIVG